jgi:hypothetical protein
MKQDLLKVKGCLRMWEESKPIDTAIENKDMGQHHRHMNVSTGVH